MLYNVVNLISGEVIISGTCQEIAYWWRTNKKFRDYKGNIHFDELNMTGKDTVLHVVKDGLIKLKIRGEYTWVTNYKHVHDLRTYQVQDEDGRSVDIRSWGKDVWEYEPPRCTYVPRWMSGSKAHGHRSSGPSMWRGTFSASMESVDKAELLADGHPVPLRDNSGVRLPFTTSTVWDYYDEHFFHQKSKSWKDQTKARKQWAKHKRNGKSQRRENEWSWLDPEWTTVEDESDSSAVSTMPVATDTAEQEAA